MGEFGVLGGGPVFVGIILDALIYRRGDGHGAREARVWAAEAFVEEGAPLDAGANFRGELLGGLAISLPAGLFLKQEIQRGQIAQQIV